jgi:antitoxin ParD1/3/4
MATIRKSITFTDKLSNWMQTRITEGEYANESEYVRDLVRRDRERNAKFSAMKTAIQDGIESGVGSKTVPQIMEEVESKLKKDGRL